MLPIIRSSAKFTPLLYRPFAWYDATTIATGAVSSWTDLSGNGFHATQGTGAAQPTCTANTLNGKNTLVFDGGNFLVCSSRLYSITNSSNTIFAIVQTSLGTTQQRIINGTEGGSSRYTLSFETTVGRSSFLSNSASSTAVTNDTATKTNATIYTAFRTGTTLSLSVNGGAATTNSSGGDENGINAMSIGAQAGGASIWLTGYIAEILIFNYALESADIIQMNRYLSNKWGIAIS